MKYYVKMRPFNRKCCIKSFTERKQFKLFLSKCFLDGSIVCAWTIDDDGNVHDFTFEEMRVSLQIFVEEAFLYG